MVWVFFFGEMGSSILLCRGGEGTGRDGTPKGGGQKENIMLLLLISLGVFFSAGSYGFACVFFFFFFYHRHLLDAQFRSGWERVFLFPPLLECWGSSWRSISLFWWDFGLMLVICGYLVILPLCCFGVISCDVLDSGLGLLHAFDCPLDGYVSSVYLPRCWPWFGYGGLGLAFWDN
ncbi:hypothetical protein F4861DRAFT_322080 [Xylaria intraflava]|nr:hypothetical protein F4861DRAFT_322080 [Xylaria intraflava]